MEKGGHVYILTNEARTVLYTGVTSNLPRRLAQHKDGSGSTFTRRYRCTILVYTAHFSSIMEAIACEKRIKSGSRADKIRLIESENPAWSEIEVY